MWSLIFSLVSAVAVALIGSQSFWELVRGVFRSSSRIQVERGAIYAKLLSFKDRHKKEKAVTTKDLVMGWGPGGR